MRRREFLGALGAAATWPLGAHAQQPALPVVGFLRSTTRDNSTRLVIAFRQGLKEAGYVESENVAIEYRWANNNLDQLAALAADLIGRKVTVIVTNQDSTLAVRAATTTTPIVFVIGGDPVKLGLVQSLSRPGGNITGLTFLQDDLAIKQLEVLRDLVPRVAVMAVMVNPTNPSAEAQSKDAQAAARAIGVQLHVANVNSERDIEPVFASLVQRQVGGMVVTGNAFLLSRRDQIVALAARHAIPTIYSDRVYAAAGGLLSYGSSQTDAYRQAGLHVSKILKGAKPAKLPVEQSPKFELVVNLKTAKALGIELPLSVEMRVSDVIE